MQKLFMFLCAMCMFSGHCAILRTDNKSVHLTNVKITSPSLAIDLNGRTFYAKMSPTKQCKICVSYNNKIYDVNDDITYLEYMYFDGNSYIDLGFPPSSDLNFEIKAWMDNSVYDHDGCLIGIRNGELYNTYGQYLVWYTNAKDYCDGLPHILPAFGGYGYNQEIIVDDEIQIIKLDNGIFSVNGVVYNNLPIAPNTSNNLTLGALNHGDRIDGRNFLGRIYYAKFWNKDRVILDLKPVLDKSGKPCMFDYISNKCFYNNGFGTFIYKI